MDNQPNKSSFWPSYVDIMTTLFAIMLVLFVVSYSRFQVKQGELVEKQNELIEKQVELERFKDKYEEIMSIYQAVDNIDPTYFEFNKQYLKHIFRIQVNYIKGEYALDKLIQDDPNSSEYNPNKANEARANIIQAGKEIQQTILNLQQNDSIKTDIKYLVVIEGQASADGYHLDDFHNNDVLSYQRALKLHEFWKRQAGIDFTEMEKCELVIAGSGEKGVPRSTKLEAYNQRFLIHIVPVIGNIHLEKP
jgi:hypothetical protein